MTIIQTLDLSKHYGASRAVDGISIQVREGEIYGFLGLNGAGKTTTIRMLLGMVRPTGGQFSLFGKPIGKQNDIWQEVGYLVETPHAYPNVTVADNLRIFARLRGLPEKAVTDVMGQLQLMPNRDKKAAHLSLGNQQRLGLAKALLHKPKLLILDEPINGLDPQGIVEVRTLLQSLATSGTTIFLSSHILSEVSKIATRIGILHKGRLVMEFDVETLQGLRKVCLCIEPTNVETTHRVLNEAGYHATVNMEGWLEVTDERALQFPEKVVALLADSGVAPRQLVRFEEDLEHFFLRTIQNANSHV